MTGTDAAVTALAAYADEYQTRVFDDVLSEFGLTRRRLPEADPVTTLKFFFRLYGFNRQGAPRETYAKNASVALEAATTGSHVDPEELWDAFVRECERTDTGVNEQLNRGVVTGAARLVNREGNLFQWVAREVDDHGRLTVSYDELSAIDGLGPKNSAFFLRDAVWISGIENCVRRQDRQRLQSMTCWISAVVEALWPNLEGATDVVLAKHVADACVEAGVSGVEFNQGAWYFGREEVGDGDAIEACVRELCTEEFDVRR